MARELVGLPMLRKCVLMDWAVRGEISVEKRHVFCHYYCLEGEIYTNGTLVAFFLTPPGFFACSFYSDYKFWHFKYYLQFNDSLLYISSPDISSELKLMS